MDMCMCGFCNVWVCISEGFVVCVCVFVYVWVFNVCVCMYVWVFW